MPSNSAGARAPSAVQASQPAVAAGGGAPGAQDARNPEPSPSAARPSLPAQAASGGVPAGSAPDLSGEAMRQPDLPRHATGGGARGGGAAPAHLPRPRAEVWAASYEPLAGEGLMAAGRQQRAFGAVPVRPSSCTRPCQSASCRLGVEGRACICRAACRPEALGTRRAPLFHGPSNRACTLCCWPHLRAFRPARHVIGYRPDGHATGWPPTPATVCLHAACRRLPRRGWRRRRFWPRFPQHARNPMCSPPNPATQSLRTALLASAAPRLALAALLAACWALPPAPGSPGGSAEPGGRAPLCLLPALGLPPLLAMLLWQAALAAAAAAWLAVRPSVHARLVRPRHTACPMRHTWRGEGRLER